MKNQFNSALSALADKMLSWFNTTIEYLPNFILALVVMVISYYSARYVSKLVEKIVAKSSWILWNIKVTFLISNEESLA